MAKDDHRPSYNTDALDDNNEKVMQCLYDRIKQENIGSDRNAVVALELVRDKLIDLFLDEDD
jgi:hypothetical protein